MTTIFQNEATYHCRVASFRIIGILHEALTRMIHSFPQKGIKSWWSPCFGKRHKRRSFAIQYDHLLVVEFCFAKFVHTR